MPATQYDTGFTDAQSVNNSKRDNFIYKDVNLYFTRNPVTSDVSMVTDVQDIKRAVRNLVLLNPGEKPFHPEIGVGLRGALFENFNPPLMALIESRIKDQCMKYEPRVEVTGVYFNDPDYLNMDNNTLHCRIQFNVRNAADKTEELDIFLKRIR